MSELITTTLVTCGDAQVYYDSSNAVEESADCLIGKIACRFEGNTTNFHYNLRSLGEYLRSQQGPKFQPYFSIKEKLDDPDSFKVGSDPGHDNAAS